MPDVEMDEDDCTTQANNGIEQIEATIQRVGLELELPYDPANALVTALYAAFWARTQLTACVANGPIATAGTIAICSNWTVLRCSPKAARNGKQRLHVRLKPHSFTEKYTVSA